MRSGSGFAGRGLLSRFPLREHGPLRNEAERPDLQALIEVGSRRVTVVVAHPPLGPRGMTFDRTIIAQIEWLAGAAVAAVPALLLCDSISPLGTRCTPC